MRPEILNAAKVGEAEFFVIATDDPDTNIKTAELVRKLYPHLKSSPAPATVSMCTA
ncbi:hypothetical protein D3C78_1854150 [compost metagenome]